MYTFNEMTRSKNFGRASSNKYLQYKWDVENYVNHRFNVKTAKSVIDNGAPLTYPHLFIRPKKVQSELERYSTIQRNNRFLMERLATIQREGGWIDNKNHYEKKSLNIWKRQQEMIHLAYNNQAMIARLLDVHAQLNKNKLEDEYLINQKYKANIRKYPSNWREIQEQMDKMKTEMFKKIFNSKYQRKGRKQAVDETKKRAASKTSGDALKAIESDKKEFQSKNKHKQIDKEHKKGKQKSAANHPTARNENLKIAKERKAEPDKRIEEKGGTNRRQNENRNNSKRIEDEEKSKKDSAEITENQSRDKIKQFNENETISEEATNALQVENKSFSNTDRISDNGSSSTILEALDNYEENNSDSSQSVPEKLNAEYNGENSK